MRSMAWPHALGMVRPGRAWVGAAWVGAAWVGGVVVLRGCPGPATWSTASQPLAGRPAGLGSGVPLASTAGLVTDRATFRPGDFIRATSSGCGLSHQPSVLSPQPSAGIFTEVCRLPERNLALFDGLCSVERQTSVINGGGTRSSRRTGVVLRNIRAWRKKKSLE
jgi:hypothetical protein